jgi:hypothetical protein
MGGIRLGRTTEIFLVVVLMTGLCIGLVAIISAGSESYSEIIENGRRIESARTALSYLNMRIRQNDTADGIQLLEGLVEGEKVLTIYHTGTEEGMATYIFYQDGWLKEIYTLAKDSPRVEDAEEIIRSEGISMEEKGGSGMLSIKARYTYEGEMREMERIIALRTGR